MYHIGIVFIIQGRYVSCRGCMYHAGAVCLHHRDCILYRELRAVSYLSNHSKDDCSLVNNT